MKISKGSLNKVICVLLYARCSISFIAEIENEIGYENELPLLQKVFEINLLKVSPSLRTNKLKILSTALQTLLSLVMA